MLPYDIGQSRVPADMLRPFSSAIQYKLDAIGIQEASHIIVRRSESTSPDFTRVKRCKAMQSPWHRCAVARRDQSAHTIQNATLSEYIGTASAALALSNLLRFCLPVHRNIKRCTGQTTKSPSMDLNCAKSPAYKPLMIIIIVGLSKCFQCIMHALLNAFGERAPIPFYPIRT